MAGSADEALQYFDKQPPEKKGMIIDRAVVYGKRLAVEVRNLRDSRANTREKIMECLLAEKWV